MKRRTNERVTCLRNRTVERNVDGDVGGVKTREPKYRGRRVLRQGGYGGYSSSKSEKMYFMRG